MVVVGKGVVNVVNWGVGCEDKVGMVFSFGVRGPSGDRCNTGHGVRAGADLIYIVSVVSLSLRRLTVRLEWYEPSMWTSIFVIS